MRSPSYFFFAHQNKLMAIKKALKIRDKHTQKVAIHYYRLVSNEIVLLAGWLVGLFSEIKHEQINNFSIYRNNKMQMYI